MQSGLLRPSQVRLCDIQRNCSCSRLCFLYRLARIHCAAPCNVRLHCCCAGRIVRLVRKQKCCSSGVVSRLPRGVRCVRLRFGVLQLFVSHFVVIHFVTVLAAAVFANRFAIAHSRRSTPVRIFAAYAYCSVAHLSACTARQADAWRLCASSASFCSFLFVIVRTLRSIRSLHSSRPMPTEYTRPSLL